MWLAVPFAVMLMFSQLLLVFTARGGNGNNNNTNNKKRQSLDSSSINKENTHRPISKPDHCKNQEPAMLYPSCCPVHIDMVIHRDGLDILSGGIPGTDDCNCTLLMTPNSHMQIYAYKPVASANGSHMLLCEVMVIHSATPDLVITAAVRDTCNQVVTIQEDSIGFTIHYDRGTLTFADGNQIRISMLARITGSTPPRLTCGLQTTTTASTTVSTSTTTVTENVTAPPYEAKTTVIKSDLSTTQNNTIGITPSTTVTVSNNHQSITPLTVKTANTIVNHITKISSGGNNILAQTNSLKEVTEINTFSRRKSTTTVDPTVHISSSSAGSDNIRVIYYTAIVVSIASSSVLVIIIVVFLCKRRARKQEFDSCSTTYTSLSANVDNDLDSVTSSIYVYHGRKSLTESSFSLCSQKTHYSDLKSIA